MRRPDPGDADLVVVNTCAFIEAARQESIDTVLALADRRRPGARLVVTGCMAERYGQELADALPEADLVAGFGVALSHRPGPGQSVAVTLGRATSTGVASLTGVASFDLLNLPRPAASAPWAYVKVAEGCDRNCGFCAIPSFRGKQRSRIPGGHPGRGGRPRCRGDRAGRPGPGVLRPRPRRAGSDRAAGARGGSAGWPAPGCCICIHLSSPTV